MILSEETPPVENYLVNTMSWRLCSPLMYKLLQQNKGAGDDLSWLEVLVETPKTDQTTQFFALRFPHPLSHDVLDMKRSIFHNGSLTKACLNRQCLSNNDIFTIQGDKVGFCVSDRVKNALIHGGCKDLIFEKICQT